MRFLFRFFSLLCVLGIPALVSGQSKFYIHDTTVKVYAYGKEQTLAFSGGFNTPQFAMADLNHDGLLDLVVYEPWNSLRTFLNMGTEGSPDYRYAPEYEVNFPPVLDFCILADYNCDGIADLFCQSPMSIQVYKGYYNTYNQLSFKFYKELFYDNDLTWPGITNTFNNPGDIPSVVDVDGDGDLDIVTYDISGGTMNLYRNMRVEKGMPCDSIYIDLADRCWGRVLQGVERTHTLQYSCDNSGLRLPKSGAKVTHPGNTPCLFDWDMDGDYDYLDGNGYYNEMTFLKNGRIEYNPTGADSMVSQDTLWQSNPGGTQIEVTKFPAAYNIDIDQDGKKDLVVAPCGGNNTSKNYNNIWFYKNYSTPGHPDWRFQSDSFLCDKTIDIGTGSYPVLFDFDKDGKPDLFVGSDGYFRASDGTMRARVSYYRNTSVAGNASFTLQTTDFNGLGSYLFKGIAPAFGDIDGDGISDMIIGHVDGTLSYLKNTAASDTLPPVFGMTELVLTDENGDTIDVAGRSAPFIYDIDQDGKKDLIIGSTFGTLQYYQNVSTVPGSIKLRLINKELGHVKADSVNNSGTWSVPFIGKLDSTGIEYLLVGSNSGNVYQYTGFQTGDTTARYTLLSSSYSYIDTDYSLYNHPSTFYGYYGYKRSAVAVGDVAGDGGFHMFVGDSKGGLDHYRLKQYVPPVISHVGVTTMNETGSILVYPNPASENLTVSWSGVQQPQLQISIINLAGQSLYSTTVATEDNHARLSVSMLPSGMYVCVLQSGVNRYYNKFTVVR